MFNKKECERCGSKINSKYKFCPSCGSLFNSEEDWGMLGQDDSGENVEDFTNSFFGNLGGGMFGKMLEGTMKMLEREIQKGIKEQRNQPRTNMQLFINGKKVNLNRVSPNTQQTQKPRKEIKEAKLNNLSQNNLKKMSSLPRQEPITQIRRLSDRIIYEIEMPDVESINDISIIKLENSIEIKALAKNKAYFKVIPINLPITNYTLSEGKLVLELGMRN